jgi:secreted Zn-dependent insulinase-like peptidase
LAKKAHRRIDGDHLLNYESYVWHKQGRHWAVISEGRSTFNREQLEAVELQKLTKEEVLAFFDANIAKGAPGRRLLICRVYCAAHASKMEKEAKATMKAAVKEFGEIEVEQVPDVETWRANVVEGRPCFPTTV